MTENRTWTDMIQRKGQTIKQTDLSNEEGTDYTRYSARSVDIYIYIVTGI